MTGRMVSRLGLYGSLLVAAAVRIPHLRFVPIWDGRQYWDDCVGPALLAPFDPLAFNCFGHRSMLYMLTVAWPQYFSHGSAVLLNVTHGVVSLLTIVAFHRVAVMLFEPREEAASGLDAALLTLLFASMPAWTGSSINLNPDMGVLTGFVFALALLLAGRRHWAVAAGLFLVLSKEIGLLLWLVLAGVETVLAITRADGRSRWREVARRWPYAIPPLAYVAVGFALRAQSRPSNWGAAHIEQRSLVETFLTFDLTAPHYVAYAADLFVMNFSWVMTVVIVLWLWSVLTAILRRRGVPLAPAVDRRRGAFIALVTPAVLYLVTRFPTFNNVRYLLTAFPLLVLAFGVAAAALVPRNTWRAALIAVAAVLQLLSMSQTIDPVSRFVFRTFPFGRHEILEMTSIRNECCGYGRDQLVYNLQFTHFDYVQEKLFAAIRPRDGEVFATARAANWFLHGPLDPKTYRRTLRRENVIRPQIVTLTELASGAPLPQHLRYLAYANVDNRIELSLYARAYRINPPLVVEENGYEAALFEMDRRVVVIPPRTAQRTQ